MDKSPGGGIQKPKHGQRDSGKIYAHGKRDRALDGFDRCIAEPLQIRQFFSYFLLLAEISRSQERTFCNRQCLQVSE